MRRIFVCALAAVVLSLTGMAAETPNRVTILYDSFGKNPALTLDWGFAALVEYGGRRILFDTGNNAKIFELIDKNTEIAPGMYLIALVSDKPGTLELHELSLAIRTPDGLVVVVGCSHPGVEPIMQEAGAINPHISILFGGLHQIQAPDPEAKRIASVLHDQYKLERVAPGHCTGEQEFAALKGAFGNHYIYAGVGSVVDLPK